ncbi:hypothetical protein B0T14DRAFT_575048 [Immersiella caudata]|uniref:Uncharacterized protein n=1 Tax=Immersiella caudata TaxID=314043 RepID=A0AA40CCJ7_9PEZI|nr:hypothetical protein B0T14DRAFT_575048 [Immersiella caudata]
MEETQSASDLEPPSSSHLRPITNLDPPLPASVLLDRELSHKSSLRRKGNILTGCPELDEYVLLGGFERGSVVGISSEDEEFALRIGLQTVANLLVSKPEARARIVTTLPPVGLLPKLREVVAGEVVERRGVEEVPGGLRAVVYGYFRRVEISRVFDFEGLGDVIGELEGEGTEDVVDGGERGVVAEDKDGGGGGEQTAPKQTKPTPQKGRPRQNNPPRTPLPDLILITHTSTLLNTLFTGRDKPTAHEKASLLFSRLHHLTRPPNHGNPLIILLNSTTSPFTPETAAQTSDYLANMARPPMPRETDPSERPRSIIEPTLRSVFGVGSAASMGRGQVQIGKPSFGNVFAKMLDVHMLCTRIPRVVDGGSSWVVEVLLDGLGVYEMEGDGEERGVVRRCREQRWGPLEVDGAGRVVAAFR